MAGRLVNVTKVFVVGRSPAANQIVNAFFDPHRQRHWLIQRFRQNADHLTAFRRVFADENDELCLPPIASGQNRRIADRRRIVRFFGHQAFPAAGRSNQFISKHSRNAIRARCNITQRLLSVIESSAQISLLGTSSISRIVKTSRTFCGSLARQSRIVCQNSLRCMTSSAAGFHSWGPLSWFQKPTETNFPENSSDRNSMSVNEVSR